MGADHFMIHVDEMAPADVETADGWRQMDIRFLVSRDSGGSSGVCFWRTVFPPGAAHERHRHPNAEEVLYVLRGRGASGVEETEHEVTPGTAEHIPAGVTHWMRNASDTEELEIVGCYAPVGSLEEAGYEFVGPIADEHRQVPPDR